MPPRISVVMPVFNGERFLAEAIQSVLDQTFGHFEFLVVDDGSTDGSLETVRRYARDDPRIRHLVGPHVGITPALNRGVAAARGDFVARMDADDIAMPDRFAVQAAFLDSHPQVVAVGSAIERIDPEGAPIAVSLWPAEHEEIEAGLLQGRGGLPHPASMIRRQSMLEIGGYREEFTFSQDKDLWLRLAELGRLANLPVPLLKYREHLGSISAGRRQEQFLGLRQVVEAACARRGIRPPSRLPCSRATRVTVDHLRRQWVRSAAKGGNFGTAWKHARSLLRERPLSVRTWWTLLKLYHHPLRQLRLWWSATGTRAA